MEDPQRRLAGAYDTFKAAGLGAMAAAENAEAAAEDAEAAAAQAHAAHVAADNAAKNAADTRLKVLETLIMIGDGLNLLDADEGGIP